MKIDQTFSVTRIGAIFGAGLITMMYLLMLLPTYASAAQISSRKVTLSSSSSAASNATTTYTFNFTVPSSTVLQSLSADVCTTPSGTCTTPTGFSVSSSTLASQPTNLGDASGWAVSTATAGSLRISKSGNVAAPTGAQTLVFGNVQNPTTANQTFYARISTFSAANWTSAVDTGVVAASTASQISLTASVDESLTFCTGTSGITSSSCAGATGSAVSFGTLSASATNSGLSQIGVGTNGNTGYAITVNGATLTSGSNTITALASQAAASTGAKQFGLNLRANTTPSVGVDPDGAGSATVNANYNTANQYRFVTGDVVASVGAADQFKRFQVSYIANIDTATAAGTYTATMNYICTPTF
jgi:hypothetical protein